MLSLITIINGLLWGSVLIYLLLGIGIFFTVKLGFIQIKHFSYMFKVMKNSRRANHEGISPFQALCTSLAARVGTGNMAGVAVALTLGGPGAIFWMWVIAFLGMATAFAESTLAQLYKVKDKEGRFRGGPAYYMSKGLGMHGMGAAFSVLLIIAFGLIFNSVQANSISVALHVAFGFEPLYIAIGLVLFTSLIIFGGMKKVARVAELVVPFMAIAYLLMALIVVFLNIEKIPDVFVLVIKSAFGFNEAASGAIGYTIGQAMINGIRRGLFSNEAGMGSAPNAAAAAIPYPHHPASQGYVQMLGVFIDTIVICTATAAVILLSGQLDTDSNMKGIELTQLALSSEIGHFGAVFIAVAIFFFAFTSIIANYFYAETNFIFLNLNKRFGFNVFRILVLGMVMFGALAKLPTVWALADLSMGAMVIINLMAIMLLSGTVIKLAKDYNTQLKLGKVPKFDRSQYPELYNQLEDGIWDGKK
ncbi:sodium:alanine symporter family protein [Vibrio sp. SS-MA-C1-2]|uniref:alanine/glycine:cation symporter family protein n=1 Tax=Vibrio sp. SS-MA-C1-2 TaxID=2908646 RepID=UPI001F1E27D8|nr:sodium:alanine symporter family protein [Vibrio sp. SS-MA-C1-2]UJF19664.1 sodium:alanine symporter family protein [Vibrio sp. SS-MA-C1-2]